MAIALPTSPNLVTAASADTATTGSFTRPTGGLLVASVSGLADAAFTVSGGSLTWTRQVQRVVSGVLRAEIWTAPVTGSGSMTVSAVGSGDWNEHGLKVDLVTGHNPASPIGATGNNVSTTNNLTAAGYTSTVANSRGFFVAAEGNGLGTPTSTDTGFGWDASDISGIAVHKAANTATSGSSVTFNADAGGTGAADWAWAALEIKPATSVDAAVTVTTVAVAATVPDLAVSISAGLTPSTVLPTVAMPAPVVTSGANVHLSAVAPSVDLPAPNITTEDTQFVITDTIEVAASLSDLGVSISGASTLATIEAVAAMYTMGVQVSASVTMPAIEVFADMPGVTVNVPVLPGDQITRPGQIEWNGFLLGNGTPYSWQELTGWRDSPPIISGNVDQPLGHGSYPGQAYAGERTINWQTRLQAADGQLATALRELIMATGVPQTEEEGYLVIWDLDGAEPYLVQAHLSERKPGPINRSVLFDMMTGALQWVASDPRLYSVIRHSATIPAGNETSILNDGNDSSPEIIRIPGPVTTPQIENTTLDRVIAFDVTVASGHTLEIDIKNGNVVDGTADKLSTLIEGSVSIKDFTLGPGTNALLYSAATGGTAMEVLWRHAIS